MSAEQDGWIERILRVALGRDSSAPDAVAQPSLPGRAALVQVGKPAPPPAGLAAWKAARANALATLKQLETAYRGFEHPDADEAVILVRAIAANLTPAPVTRPQLDELQAWLEEDDIIGEAEEPNGFGIGVSLRAPLLAAIGSVRAALPGGGGGR